VAGLYGFCSNREPDGSSSNRDIDREEVTMIPMCGQRWRTWRASETPSIVPGIFTSVKSS
jgi:hypothetical protein